MIGASDIQLGHLELRRQIFLFYPFLILILALTWNDGWQFNELRILGQNDSSDGRSFKRLDTQQRLQRWSLVINTVNNTDLTLYKGINYLKQDSKCATGIVNNKAWTRMICVKPYNITIGINHFGKLKIVNGTWN
jgi:hypothetical protein